MKRKLSHKGFIEAFAYQTQTDCTQAEKISAILLGEITHALVHGQHLEVRGFGSLKTSSSFNRQMRNPKTGEIIVKPELKRIQFTMAKQLKCKINISKNLN